MNYKYCDDDVYKDDTYDSLSSQFDDNRQKFETFYSSLNDLETKNEFLRVGSTYLFFVKIGDWHVNVPRSNPVIEYFTNSFKLVAILAIIESLSDKEHIDFFEWLSEKDKKGLFPIEDKAQLRKHYNEYKIGYGSIRRCKSFFSNLSVPTKNKLRNAITINGEPVETIEKAAVMIYQARSNFAHESMSTLEISNCWCFSKEKNKEVIWKLPMKLLQSSFEEGVVAYFNKTITNQHQKD